MSQTAIQYISDEKGNITGVIVPIEFWREIESEKETAYLLRSEAMKKRLLEARNRKEGISFEEVCEKLGIWKLNRKRGLDVMGRVRTNVMASGKNCWTLFDTGARNNYILQDLVSSLSLPVFKLDKPQPASLGGEVHNVQSVCFIVDCLVEELPITAYARILDEIGLDEEGKRIEFLIGALTMQEWGIRPIPVEERLDMTHYPKKGFIEF